MRFLIFIWICIFQLSGIHASEYIDVNLSSDTITLGESVQVDISVNASEITLSSLEFEIPGIENFDIFSQSQSESYRNINGEVERNMLYSLSIIPVETWEFTLWPIKLITQDEEIIDDMKLPIIVSETSAISPPKVDAAWTVEENIDLREDSEDIKGLRIPKFPWWVLVLLMIIVTVIFYVILDKILSWKKGKKVKTYKKIIPQEDMYSQYRKYFTSLEKEIWKDSSKVFFRKYNTWIRKILVTQWIIWAETVTLKELTHTENIQDNSFFHILKKSYKYEYNTTLVSTPTQQKYIDDILKLLSSWV